MKSWSGCYKRLEKSTELRSRQPPLSSLLPTLGCFLVVGVRVKKLFVSLQHRKILGFKS